MISCSSHQFAAGCTSSGLQIDGWNKWKRALLDASLVVHHSAAVGSKRHQAPSSAHGLLAR